MDERGRKKTPDKSIDIMINPDLRIENEIRKAVIQALRVSEVELTITEVPPEVDADYGFQVVSLARRLGENPVALASNLASRLNQQDQSLFEEVTVMGSYLNFKLKMRKFGSMVVDQVLRRKTDYGKETTGKGKRVVIDMSSPNIAKRMSYGHLRSTIIGDALANLYRVQGYEVVRDNHIGDWGTQFGKLIVAIKKWGDERQLLASDDPIGILQDLYVKFHEEAEQQAKEKELDIRKKIGFSPPDVLDLKGPRRIPNIETLSQMPGLIEEMEVTKRTIMSRKRISKDLVAMDLVLDDAIAKLAEPDLEKEGREWFLRLEQGNREARRLWKLCVDLSMKEFEQIYQILGVSFEEALGESFYENQLQNVVSIVKRSKAGETSEGALVVDMQDKSLGVAIVQKSDGASVYLTRDLACAIYRQQHLKAERAIYVVGEDQKLYFQQLFEILRRLGYKIGDNCEHVYFGMVRLPEGKMSTRKGRTILLRDVVEEGFSRVKKLLEERSSESTIGGPKIDKIIRQIAVGALKWNDLSQDPRRGIVFDWDKALNLEGNSAPYVQYAAVRANRILEQGGTSLEKVAKMSIELTDRTIFGVKEERSLVRCLAEYPSVLRKAREANNPSVVAAYLYELARRFSTFYTKISVLKSETGSKIQSRLKLVAAVLQTITNGLGILGIEVPEEM